MIATNVFKLPGKGIKTRLPTHAQWGGGPNVLLVLDTRNYKGKTWLRVALPDRPNGSSGWIREDFVRLSTSRWRVTHRPRLAPRDRLLERAQAAQLPVRDRRAGDADAARALCDLREAPAAQPEGLPRAVGAAPDGLLERAAQLRRRALAASRSTAATARAWPTRSDRRARTAASASTIRTSSGWRASSRSARPCLIT